MVPTILREGVGGKSGLSWEGFEPGLWQKDINVRDFIQQNYEPYEGDGSFLAPATERTEKLWFGLTELFVKERNKGVLEVSQIPSSITSQSFISSPSMAKRMIVRILCHP